MLLKIASQDEYHKLLSQYPGVKNVVWNDDENTYLLIALNQDNIEGFVFVFRRNIPAPVGDINEDYINAIEVFGKHKNGLGTRLVEQVIKIAKRDNSYQVRAYCDINNESSHRLWLKNNFVINPVKERNGNIVGSYVTYKI